MEPNGNIIGYVINYKFFERDCRSSGNIRTNQTNVTTEFATLENLYPNWNYTISVAAKTAIGLGPSSENMVLKTSSFCKYVLF